MAPDARQVGEGRWVVDLSRPLGDPGGFGRVFEGSSSDGSLEVAIKLVETTGSVTTELARREIEIVEKLRDIEPAHVIALYEAGPMEGGFYIVMERAEYSLADAIDRDLELDTSVLEDIAAGLEHLHGAGVIHRDLKPGNVLRADESWKLSDFGISRDILERTGTLTFAGAGTPPYMSPEQWHGRSPSVKTDLYALGCVAYELMTGDTPFRGPDVEDFRRQHLQEGFADLPDRVAPSMRALIQRLLAKDPDERPQDARAVRERLARIVATPSEIALRLQALHATHERERSEAEVERIREEARSALMSAHRRQAVADLQELLEEGYDELSLALADVTFKASEHEPTWRIAGEHARLNIELWSARLGDIDEPKRFLAAAGHISASSRRRQAPIALANIVCRLREDRLEWQILRCRPGLGHTFQGVPNGQSVGLTEGEFRNDYERGLLPDLTGLHTYQLSTSRLHGSSIVVLYEEALAL